MLSVLTNQNISILIFGIHLHEQTWLSLRKWAPLLCVVSEEVSLMKLKYKTDKTFFVLEA